jgi:DMSO/TMAO reductase YedYZ molybdopterin-dependent catalytic subunit
LIDNNVEVRKQSARRTRRNFLVAAAAAAAGYEFYRWVDRAPLDELLQEPLRKSLEFNAGLSRDIFHEHALAPTYPVAKSVPLRVNGNYGLKQELVPENYRLQVVGVDNPKSFPQYVDDVTAWEYKYIAGQGKYEGHDTKVAPKDEAKPTDILPAFAAAMDEYYQAHADKPQRGQEEAGESDSTLAPHTPGLLLGVADLTRLPHRELVTQFKCIEGWSEIVHWGGLRLADFIGAYPPARNPQGELPRYVYMETPNGDYYCGFELRACMHPQSLLVTEMAGKPLTTQHGAPLRLHMPIKYGYKQIKRIGLIAYTDDKPDDYWTKLGYDWYAGL